MLVTCEKCSARYNVDDAKIPAGGVRARCPKCNHSFFLAKAMAPPPQAPPPVATPPPAPPVEAPLPNPFADSPFGEGDPFAGFEIAEKETFEIAHKPAPAPESGLGSDLFDPSELEAPVGEWGAVADSAPAPHGEVDLPEAADPFGGMDFDDLSQPLPAADDPFALGGDFADPSLASLEAPREADDPTPATSAAPSDPADPFASFGDPFSMSADSLNPSAAAGAAPASGASGVQVRTAQGEVIGPMDLFDVKQLIYEHKLDGTETVSEDGKPFIPIGEHEELASIFRLLGVEPTKMSQPAEPRPMASSPARHASPPPAVSPAAPRIPSQPVPAPSLADIEDEHAAEVATGGFDADRAGEQSASERMQVRAQRLKKFFGSPRQRVLLATGVLVVLAGAGAAYWWTQIAHRADRVDHETAQETAELAEGKLYSGVGGILVGGAENFHLAFELRAKDPKDLARSAEARAGLWDYAPSDFRLRDQAVAALAEAEKAGAQGAAVTRVKIRMASAEARLEEMHSMLSSLKDDPAERVAWAFLESDRLLRMGEFEGAAKVLDAAKPETERLRFKTGWVDFGLARAYFQLGRWKEAGEATAAALAVEPEHAGVKVLSAYLDARTAEGGAPRGAIETVLADERELPRWRGFAAYLLARLDQESGSLDRAVTSYRTSLLHYAGDGVVVAHGMKLFQQIYENKDAKRWIDAVGTVRGTTELESIRAGEAALARGALPEAVGRLEDALGKDPESARVQVALARLYLQAGGREGLGKALTHSEKAIGLDPLYAEALLLQAKALRKLDRMKDAQQAIERSLDLDPVDSEARLLFADLALIQEDFAGAVAQYDSVTNQDPHKLEAWMGLGRAQGALGRTAQAIAALTRAEQEAPSSAEVKLLIGDAFQSIGKLDQAARLYEEALKLEPKNPKVKVQVGIMMVRAEQFEKAVEYLAPLVTDDPYNAQTQFQLAKALMGKGDTVKASEHLRRAADLDPSNAEAYFLLGEMAFKDSRLAEAKEYLTSALKKDEQLFAARVILAEVLTQLHSYDEALVLLGELEKAVGDQPPSKQKDLYRSIYLQMGDVWWERPQRNLERAQAFYARAIAADSSSAEAHYRMGQVYLEGSPINAIKEFIEARKADPNYAPAYRNLGYLYKDLGKCASAIESLQEYLKRAPRAADRAEVADEVERLRGDCR